MVSLSIIIPVYNVSLYLSKCLDSLCRQLREDTEVILINDGSTDNSGLICNEYSSKYCNITIKHISNGGVSNARNVGISLAHGRFITFIDSDDWVANDYIDQLLLFCQKDVDLVVSGITNYRNEEMGESVRLNPSSFILKYSEDLISILQTPLMTSPVAKVYRRSLIQNNNLRFNPAISFAEDYEFNLSFLQYVKSVFVSDYVGYCYRRETVNSLSKLDHPDQYKNRFRQWKLCKSIFVNNKQENKSESIHFLVNLLHNIIFDYISSEMVDYYFLRTFDDISYYKQNCKYVDSTKWQVVLIKHEFYRLLKFISIIK